MVRKRDVAGTRPGRRMGCLQGHGVAVRDQMDVVEARRSPSCA
jgi:hypothetical protein